MPESVIQRTQQAAWHQARNVAHASWLYPFKGIYYFATHRFLWPLLRSRILPCFFLSAFVLITLFTWTYLPQWAFLKIFLGRSGAWLGATFLVLGEGSAITALLFEAFLVDEAQVDIFDAVLINEGCSDLVTVTRPVDVSASDPVKQLGKPHRSSVYSPFSLRQIVEFAVLLPLTFVPWIGVPLFLWLTGYRAGPFQHWRYFELRGFTKAERNAFVKQRRLQYTTFGTVALVLQLVPVASMLFLLTSSAGSALWAADIQRKEQEQEEDQQQQHDTPASPPPQYTEYIDNPV